VDVKHGALAGALLGAACTSGRDTPRAADTLVVYVAASLTKPLMPVLDSFAATGVVVQRESGASLEHARKLTELHRIPDVVLLADYEVFPQLLVPAYTSWYAQFARNRMVVAYTPRSKHATEISPENWTRVVRRPDVQVGRTDPKLAPAGYRTLRLFTLAERFYHEPGLERSLLAAAPERNMRANAADLAALLAAGELDYIYDYQSVAQSNGFSFVQLPAEIDLRPVRSLHPNRGAASGGGAPVLERAAVSADARPAARGARGHAGSSCGRRDQGSRGG
jgi:molybdate/tungstate transport system substrate-binding protein